MNAKLLLKRVLIDLAVVATLVIMVLPSLYVYVWIKEGPERAKARREAAAFVTETDAAQKASVAMGSVNLGISALIAC